MNDHIEIKLSKTKLIFLLIAGIAFSIIGFQVAISTEDYLSILHNSPLIIRVPGIFAICFFGIICIFLAQKIFDNKPGLTIDQYEITNNSNATNMGLIEWNDNTGMEKKQVASTMLLIILTSKPEKYINRTKNIIAKKAMKLNDKFYGSPISITSNSLKIDFNELEKIIRVEFEKRKKH